MEHTGYIVGHGSLYFDHGNLMCYEVGARDAIQSKNPKKHCFNHLVTKLVDTHGGGVEDEEHGGSDT